MIKKIMTIMVILFLLFSTESFAGISGYGDNEVINKSERCGDFDKKNRHKEEKRAESKFIIKLLSLNEVQSELVKKYFNLRIFQGSFFDGEMDIGSFYYSEFMLFVLMLNLDHEQKKILNQYYESKYINKKNIYRDKERNKNKKRIIEKSIEGIKKDFNKKDNRYYDTEYGEPEIINLPKNKKAH